ncbi:BRCA1-associated RING domain protein 1 [Lobosporangium transversale]|nr:BRCA1-associated RING domain protein 1 [Lobosporangium transversale]
MTSFDDALENFRSLLCCSLCGNELESTVTVKECGHHFCRTCIYNNLGTLCKCPTCGIPARVGNLLRNPSYDILVACASKLRDLHPSAKQQNNSEASDSGTPVGSLLWTFDCGPTFSNSAPLSLASSEVEAHTFPSLNTILAIHDKERAHALQTKNHAQNNDQPNTDQQTSVTEVLPHNEKDIVRQLMPPPLSTAQPRPVPTMSQLQSLLGIHKGKGVEPVSLQGNEIQTMSLHTASQPETPPEDMREFSSPRMPSPTLRLYESSLESLQATNDVSVDQFKQGDSSQNLVRPNRKRRMMSDDTRVEQRLFKDTIAGDRKSPPKTTNHDNVFVVESSQPTLDLMTPSLVIHDSLSRGSKHRSSSPMHSSVMAQHNISSKAKNSSEPLVITTIFTGLNKEQRNDFDSNLSRVIEAGLQMEHIQDQPFNESTTHIITNADQDTLNRDSTLLCPRVLKYLHGMLSSPWIVDHKWFLDSIEAKEWLQLPNSRYVIQGDLQFGPAPGTQTRREIRNRMSLKLFHSCRMFFYGSFGSYGQKAFTRDELLKLVRDGGAETWLRRPAAAKPSSTPPMFSSKGVVVRNFFSRDRQLLYVTEDFKPWEISIDRSLPIIVCDPNSIPSGGRTLTQAEVKKHGWLREHQAVSLTWILNCISCSLMGAEDICLLYGTDVESAGEEAIHMLSEAWTTWRKRR